MFLDKSAQSAKLSVLQKIIDMMDDKKAEGLKKPDAAIIDITAKDPDGDGDDDSAELGKGSPLDALKGGKPGEDDGKDGGEDDELLQRLMAEYAKVK